MKVALNNTQNKYDKRIPPFCLYIRKIKQISDLILVGLKVHVVDQEGGAQENGFVAQRLVDVNCRNNQYRNVKFNSDVIVGAVSVVFL